MFSPNDIENDDIKASNVIHLNVILHVIRMSFARHSYVLVCHLYVIRMSLVCTRMSPVYTHMSPVCYSYVLVCHPYVTRLWFYHEHLSNSLSSKMLLLIKTKCIMTKCCKNFP